MTSMKAAVYDRYGSPDVVRIADIPKPVPAPDEALIQVHTATVNRTDSGFRSADYFIVRFFSGLITPRNKTLGNEFAGVVASVGTGVTSLKPGDNVFGYNDRTFGTHAEYMIMKEAAAIAAMPAGFGFDDAAAITEGAHYALCDIRAAQIRPGQQWLINGATGAIGSAAVQLAKYFGAEVTAVCRTEHLDLVRSLGADAVIDYTQQDFTTIGKTFDVIFDAVGKSSFGKCKKLLKERGIYMSTELGPRWENPLLALITPLRGGKKVLFPLPSITKEDVVFLKNLCESGKFKSVIDRKYPLEQIVEAYRYVETGQKVGNVLLKIV